MISIIEQPVELRTVTTCRVFLREVRLAAVAKLEDPILLVVGSRGGWPAWSRIRTPYLPVFRKPRATLRTDLI
jgi:hypothetical protein